jgi:hypothetical protein
MRHRCATPYPSVLPVEVFWTRQLLPERFANQRTATQTDRCPGLRAASSLTDPMGVEARGCGVTERAARSGLGEGG